MNAPAPPRRLRPHWALAVVLAVLSAGTVSAQSNDDCLMCHEDRTLTGERNGREISVWVDAKRLAGSVHAGLDCVACHQDLEGAELPHGEDVARVDCGTCHDTEAEAHAESLHGQAAKRGDPHAPSCVDCHGHHDVLSPKNPRAKTATMNIPALCGGCHREGSPVSREYAIPQHNILANYSESIHGEGLYGKGLSVTAVCTSCHTSHLILPHTDPRSSINRKNITKTCTQCHARIEEVHRKVVEGKLWETEPGKIPACVDCHSPHKIRRVFYDAGMANKDCLRCHGDPQLTMQRDGETISLFVDQDKYAASAHAEKACAQCHTEVTASHARPCETIKSKVDCSICHAEPVQQYNSGVHGRLHAEGDPDAPVCLDCHEKHDTHRHRNPASPTFARNVPDLCGRCHRTGQKAAVRINDEFPPVESYHESIHGKGLEESGLVVTATCVSCHTAHHELPPDDPASSVNRENIAGTCGTCHHGIEEQFRKSIHATGEPTPEHQLPTCDDCHSSHRISRVDKADFRFVMMDQCGRCHEKEAETFFDTFHGKVSRLGSAGAAKCYDCHGTHNILPPYEPNSTLSRDNVVQTCAQCHEGAHRRFAGYLTHATHHDPYKYPYLWLSFWGMTLLLVGTLTFALLHTGAWLTRLWLSREDWQHHKMQVKAAPGEKLYRRFDRLQRTMHLIMLLSFFTLALTGMTLKFSYMTWAQGLSVVLGGFKTMGILHRIAALTLFTVFFVHLWDVRRRRKRSGKTWWGMITGPESILFNMRDLREVAGSIKWFFGMGPRPKYGRYTYWEKFDYFAVFWGVFVIGSTGLVLWFPEVFTYLLPGWSVNVATIIHSDEALLAVAFIFTVHFFNTHFRPDKFPMDSVIFTGRVPLEELKADKPDEYERMVASGELEQHLVDPFPKSAEKGFRVFGFVMLGIGLTLIVFIVYTMMFGYR